MRQPLNDNRVRLSANEEDHFFVLSSNRRRGVVVVPPQEDAPLVKILGPLALVLVFLWLFLWWRAPSKVNEQPVPIWKHSLEQAEILQKEGDFYGASGFYAHAARLAASVDDWEGLLAVACGLQKIGDPLESPMNSHAILIHAMLAAQRTQSTEGLQAVAMAFKLTGEWFASIALSGIRKNWFQQRLTPGELNPDMCGPEAQSMKADDEHQ
jgi:hypothetical protein